MLIFIAVLSICIGILSCGLNQVEASDDSYYEVVNESILEEEVIKYLVVSEQGQSASVLEEIVNVGITSEELEFINNNIQLMNELADSEVGYIDETGTFVMNDEVVYAAQASGFSFHASWTKITFTMNSTGTAIFAGLASLIRIGVLTKGLSFSTIKSLTNSSLTAWIYELFTELPLSLGAEVISYMQSYVGLFVSAIVTSLGTLISICASTAGVGTIVVALVSIILGMYLPNLITAVQMIYNSVRYGMSCCGTIKIWKCTSSYVMC